MLFHRKQQRTGRVAKALTHWHNGNMENALSRPANLIEYLKTIDSPTLSNAIETLNLQRRDAGFTPLQIRCLFPELGRLCGYAVTAQVETITGMHPTEEHTFLELFNAVGESPAPARVALLA